MTDWTPLESELDRWSRQGLDLPLWWRDDDAVSDSPALQRLADLSRRHGLAVHLAVIPAEADAALAAAVGSDGNLVPVVHGWSHASHAPRGEKKAEFGPHRPVAAMAAELHAGRSRLVSLFGGGLRPMLVPPWNRIAPDLIPRLPGLGFAALSTFTPRAAPLAAPGVALINTHLDPIDWRGTRGLINPDRLIAKVAAQLADRRMGRADALEPYGLLTHHLVHDSAVWHFVEALLERLMAGPVRTWIAPASRKEPEDEPT